AYNEKNYVLPRGRSSADLATEVLRLGRTLKPDDIPTDTKRFLDEAKTFLADILRAAEQQAAQLAVRARYFEAVTSRERALKVKQDFEDVRKIWEALSSHDNASGSR